VFSVRVYERSRYTSAHKTLRYLAFFSTFIQPSAFWYMRKNTSFSDVAINLVQRVVQARRSIDSENTVTLKPSHGTEG